MVFTKGQTVIPKKKQGKRGPAPTGHGHPIMVRVHEDLLASIDNFAASQFEPLSRPEAVRLLAEMALDSFAASAPPVKAKRK
jgi:hypothetical protein